jgi:hypothetical protein
MPRRKNQMRYSIYLLEISKANARSTQHDHGKCPKFRVFPTNRTHQLRVPIAAAIAFVSCERKQNNARHGVLLLGVHKQDSAATAAALLQHNKEPTAAAHGSWRLRLGRRRPRSAAAGGSRRREELRRNSKEKVEDRICSNKAATPTGSPDPVAARAANRVIGTAAGVKFLGSVLVQEPKNKPRGTFFATEALF